MTRHDTARYRSRMLTFRAADVAVEVDLSQGGRLSSLMVGDRQLLVTDAPDAIDWGWYPMAPWAGRTRRGRFDCGGVEYQLPLHTDGHAIHGTVFRRPWHDEGDGSWSTDLGPDWPFAGAVRQRMTLESDHLLLELELSSHAEEFPAAIGWHPWFRRRIDGAEARIELPASFMLRRDAEGIATRQEAPVPDEPWDDCFGGLVQPVVVEWPGVLELAIESDCPYVVVFTEKERGVCVEPQTGPPDALNEGGVEVARLTPPGLAPRRCPPDV